ncbi:MAG: shikimate kinase [Prevotellaceae bacterium]|jgi:shikimate kinase|nr:shikimate kinase [Prevotellaceae bacterium]
MSTISLIGFMGCGKTTVGRQLAQVLQRTFFDTDAVVEELEGKTVFDVFAAVGEARFRRYEFRVMRQLLPPICPCVMACGGGLPCASGAMAYLNQYSVTVYLQAPVDVLCARLQGCMAQRPLLRGAGDLRGVVEQLLAQREPFYRQAQWFLNTEGKSVEELCLVLQALAEGDI